MQINVPQQIGGADLISYLVLTNRHTKTGYTRHFVGGELVTDVFCLAICQYENNEGFYLFYCNKNWETITDTFHDTVEGAKDQAEFEFENTFSDWSK